MAVFRVERNSGYTVMSNHHLRNKELTLKAKGLLSQMLSLPEDWDYYYANEAGIYSEKDLGPLANYIDYERYGRDIAMDEQGRFADEGYVRVASERWDRQFDGELDDIPGEYRITGSGEDAERDNTLAVLVVEPGIEPYVKEIESGLKSLQHEVGGDIQAVYPYEEPVALL